MSSLWERYKPLLNFVLALAAVLGLFGPNVIVPADALDALKSFFQAPDYYLFASERPFLVLLAIGLLYNGIVTARYRNIPITALSTSLELHFEDADGVTVTSQRKQVIRANHPNVTAYYTEVSPSRGGIIRKEEINFWLDRFDGQVAEEMHKYGREDVGWECIQMFARPLPYKWYLPLLPESLLLIKPQYLPRFIRRLIVIRHGNVTYRNEFNRPDPFHQFRSIRYTHKRISIELHFHEQNMPSYDDILAHRISSNGVLSEKVTRQQKEGRKYFRIEVDRLINERLRVSWKHPTITDYI